MAEDKESEGSIDTKAEENLAEQKGRTPRRDVGNRVEQGIDDSEDELFGDTFEMDEDEANSRKKLKKKAAELKEQMEKDKARIKKEEKKSAMETRKSEEEPEESGAEEEPEEDEADLEEDELEEDEKEAEEETIEEKKPEKKRKKLPRENELDRQVIKDIILKKAEQAVSEPAESITDDVEAGIEEKGVKEQQAREKEANKNNPVIKPDLKFLEDDGNVFIGRKSSVFKNYGSDAALLIGRVGEDARKDANVFLDALNPHVVFVCGARGSGKSYVLGVIAEELAKKNKNVGIIVIDPIGVFWSMRFPNREERELELLGNWGLEPEGLENLTVFVPEGVKKDVPKETYDNTFAMPPSLLTADDWCLTFGIERFSPSGLLLEKSLQKTKEGYKTKDEKFVKGKAGKYSLEDIIQCLETDSEISSSDRGYKPDSIRALVSRFDAAKSWGIFSAIGTPLGELSREGQLSIIDTSFLDDNVSALVIGILSRRILAARKKSTRREASQRFKEVDIDEMLESEIPPTWLFIDEAHTLIPGGNIKTPASTALIEYVKQGRQPGCSLVFATQQPSAIDSKVLSQLDIIMSHKLVFDDDIKAVFKRTPTIVPHSYKAASFIKTLPIGTALTGDRREETSRAFVMKIRPRMSQHEGREAVTTELQRDLNQSQVKKLAVGMVFASLERAGILDAQKIEATIKTLNAKYKVAVSAKEIVQELVKKGAVLNEKNGTIAIPGVENEESIAEELAEETKRKFDEIKKPASVETMLEIGEGTTLLAFPTIISLEQARKIFNKMRKKKFVGIFGEDEIINDLFMTYAPIHKAKFNIFSAKNTFREGIAYINAVTGEFIHYNKKIIESSGLGKLKEMDSRDIDIIHALSSKKKSLKEIILETGLEEMNTLKVLDGLSKKGIVSRERENNQYIYSLKETVDLPANPLHPVLSSMNALPVSEHESLNIEIEQLSTTEVPELLKKLWKNVIVKDVSTVYMPLYEAVFKKKNGIERKKFINAVTGEEIRF